MCGGKSKAARGLRWSHKSFGVQTKTVQKPNKALEMFCGIGSATRMLTECGFEITSVDNDPKYHPDICDIISSIYIIYHHIYYIIIYL